MPLLEVLLISAHLFSIETDIVVQPAKVTENGRINTTDVGPAAFINC